MAKQLKPKKSAPDTIWEVLDGLWDILVSILQENLPTQGHGTSAGAPPPRGQPHHPSDTVGCQWNKLPDQFGSDRTVHRWFQAFCRDRVFERLWGILAEACDDLDGVDWRWQSADGRMGKARSGGEKVGRNPTDRGKPGTKISLLVEGAGRPLGVALAGANVPDCKLLEETIGAVVVDRPEPTADVPPESLPGQGV